MDDALAQSAQLLRRSDTLRTQSERARAASASRRAAADEKMDKSRRSPCRLSCVAGSVPSVDPGSGDSAWLDREGFEAVRVESRALRQTSTEARTRARAARDRARRGRSQREILRDSAFARLLTRMGTISVIEQARGIVIAHQGCGPDEAFDLLCQASQRTNIKVHVLAAQIVEHSASRGRDNATPIALDATRFPRSRAADSPRP